MKGGSWLLLHPLLPILLYFLQLAYQYVDYGNLIDLLPSGTGMIVMEEPVGLSSSESMVDIQVLKNDAEQPAEVTARRLNARAARTAKIQRLFAPAKCEEDDCTMPTILSIASPLVNAIIVICVWVVVAVMYKSSVTDQRAALPNPVPPEFNMGDKDFKWGICQCCADITYCLHGCCCWDVRVADTYSLAGVSSYWGVLFLICVFYLLGTFGYIGCLFAFREIEFGDGFNLGGFAYIGFYVPQMILALLMAQKRGALRQRLGGQNNKCFMDFICWWWCACCVSIQEGRQVDEIQEVRVDCCCKLTKLGGGGMVVMGGAQPVGMVGQPVAIGQVVGQPVTVAAENKAA